MTQRSGEAVAHPVERLSPRAEQFTRSAITTVLAVIALLTFTFSFGNVWALGLRLGVPNWIAPLIGPAVDLSVTGLLVGVRYLALHGANPEQLRGARLLLVFSGAVCLALNTAGAVGERAFGRSAFDAVGPLLLLGWAEVGPALLRQIHSIGPTQPAPTTPAISNPVAAAEAPAPAPPVPARTETQETRDRVQPHPPRPHATGRRTIRLSPQILIQARRIDAEHRAAYDRPASAATLRGHLHIGGPESNHLVKIVRGRLPESSAVHLDPQSAA